MTVMHPDLREAVQQAGQEPLRLMDPDTNTEYVLVRADVYQKVRQLLQDDPREAYPAIDEAWKEGWDDPKMADYDHYEEHRS